MQWRKKPLLQLESKYSLFLLIFYRPERFKASTVAHSGINPLGSFASFMSKDPIKNIDVRRDDKPPVDIEKDYGFMKNRVPYGATTYIYKTGKLGKDWNLDRSKIE